MQGVNIMTEEQIATAMSASQQDISFLVDEIHRRDNLIIGSDTHKTILVAGHSLGGATAAAALLTDRRIHAGINIDGSFQPPFADSDINCPFLLAGNENMTLVTEPSWQRMWPRFRSTKAAVNVRGATHSTFTDLSFIATKLGFSTTAPSGMEDFLGTIDDARAVEIVTAYITAFARFVAGWESTALAARARKAFPEVSVLGEEAQGRCK